jgi:hypothetical protein
MLSEQDLASVDDFRFGNRMPGRATAIREVFRRGLRVKGDNSATTGSRSTDFGVLLTRPNNNNNKRKTSAG